MYQYGKCPKCGSARFCGSDITKLETVSIYFDYFWRGIKKWTRRKLRYS
jgi:predicted nucleic-acid-binding Zn-ribbon protein